MEDAAMKAYAADISRGADMTSQAINAFAALQESSAEATVKTHSQMPGPSALPARAIDPLMPPIDVLEEEEQEKRERMKKKGEVKSWTNETEATQSMWCEAKSDEGHTYFWNVKTGDTKWEVPKEGYMTLEEYNRLNKLAEAQQQLQLHKESMFMRGNADEIVAKYYREKLKERRPKPTPSEVAKVEEEKEQYKTYEEPGWSAKPLGEWTTVTNTEPMPVDLQLPEPTHNYVYVPAAHTEPEPPIKKFKEKTITSLPVDDESAGAFSTFKKRKIAIKRSARQRNDDE
ncbi:WW domain-binding protein 4 [Pseudolycoriella hygida]|uniref:WW domain-binding protein 4 n=1 Tax=Pseudolycoriella hygida TaxID=35572 RepID=A0A9Q0SAF2_9DIPT|nr:WW domain-binding protein 4 [Pseudolycoriella hygida]